MIQLKLLIIVAIGGAIGAGLRYIISTLTHSWLGGRFPFGILIVNSAGSLLMGIVIGLLLRYQPLVDAKITWPHRLLDASPSVLLHSFIAVGLLGGLTTFSSFSLDAINLIERGDYGLAAIYIFGSVGLALIGLLFGLWVTR